MKHQSSSVPQIKAGNRYFALLMVSILMMYSSVSQATDLATELIPGQHVTTTPTKDTPLNEVAAYTNSDSYAVGLVQHNYWDEDN